MSPDTARKEVETWVVKHLANYDPIAWNDKRERPARRKAFAELSLFLCFKAWCGAAVPRTLARFVIDIVNSREFLGLAARIPSEFLCYAPAMSYAAQAGELSPRAREIIRAMGAEDTVKASERVPYRYLDYILACETVLGQPPYDGQTKQGVYALSILGHRMVAGQVNIEDAYALTHSLFYATKFGSDLSLLRERPELVPRLDDIDAAICRFVAEDNLDVALELAIARMIVNPEGSTTLSFCIARALERFEALGYLPPPPEDDDGRDEPWSIEFRDWAKRYHTTMLLGLALDFAAGHDVPVAPAAADAGALELYGRLLGAVFDANVYTVCLLTAQLLTVGAKDLPGADYQLGSVTRMLQRHLALVQRDGDCGFLVDAVRMGALERTSDVDTSMESVNRLVRLVLNALLRPDEPGPGKNTAEAPEPGALPARERPAVNFGAAP